MASALTSSTSSCANRVGCAAICGTPRIPTHVDHDHETGAVRGHLVLQLQRRPRAVPRFDRRTAREPPPYLDCPPLDGDSNSHGIARDRAAWSSCRCPHRRRPGRSAPWGASRTGSSLRRSAGTRWTRIDRGAGEQGWSAGNRVEVLVDGADYFERLFEVLSSLRRRRLAALHRLGGHARRAARRPGYRGRRRCWNGWPRATSTCAGCLAFASGAVELLRTAELRPHDGGQLGAGGELLLDERVRRGREPPPEAVRDPSRRRRATTTSPFVGGIDLSHGRHDDARHRGDRQAVELNDALRPEPAVARRAAPGAGAGGRARWPTRSASGGRTRRRSTTATRSAASSGCSPASPAIPTRCRPDAAEPAPAGTHAVQVLRTYPAKRPTYPFAPDGERSIARAYLKALAAGPPPGVHRGPVLLVADRRRTRWPTALTDAARSSGWWSSCPGIPIATAGCPGPPHASSGNSRCASVLPARAATGSWCATSRTTRERPIYVHAKVCIVDDVWMMVGSDNMNRRSWTHDSELSCAVLDDDARRTRAASIPAGLGDGARRLARDTRLQLWREHLGRTIDDRRRRPRRSRLRVRRVPSVGAHARRVARARLRRGATPRSRAHASTRARAGPPPLVGAHVGEVVNDPDGRPRSWQRADRY